MTKTPRTGLRYARQCRILGVAADAKLHKASVAVVGVGGTGSFLALLLAQLGVKRIVLIDRDNVMESNLNRQALYTSAEVGRPKALAAAKALKQINPAVRVDARVDQLTRANALALLKGVDLVLDGSDNYATRVAVDEACAKLRVPWVHCAALGAAWQVSTFLPRAKPRFVAVFPKPKREVSCEDAGILNAAASMAASVAVGEFTAITAHNKPALAGRLAYGNVLDGTLGTLNLQGVSRVQTAVRT